MEHIIEALEDYKKYYLRDIEYFTKEVTREQGYIEASEERITEAQTKIAKAQGFIDQYDEAIAKLRG